MAPYLLRSAVAILRRPTPPSAFLRCSPIDRSRFFASGGAVRVEPAKACCMARIEMEADLEKVAVNLRLRALEEKLDILEEHERRFQRSERFQKKLACVLIPATIALYVFGPEKKAKEQSD